MDNFFEILIYLVIIISFLSSIFKKKKQQQKKPPARPDQQEEYPQPDVSVAHTKSKEEYDILKEIEDFFKVGSEMPGQGRTTVAQPEEPESIIETKEHIKSDSWHSPTVSEHSYTDDWERKKAEVKKRTSRVDSGIEKQAAKFEESLVKTTPLASEINSLIKTKIKSPSTLKEYIIFSEILGKPKALRR